MVLVLPMADTEVVPLGSGNAVSVLMMEAVIVVVGGGVVNGTTSRRDERAVGTGCAACVVVFRAGSKAMSGMTVGLNGQIPVF